MEIETVSSTKSKSEVRTVYRNKIPLQVRLNGKDTRNKSKYTLERDEQSNEIGRNIEVADNEKGITAIPVTP